MSDVGFGVGVVLAVLGPLLLLPVVWLCYRLVTLPVLRARPRDWTLPVGRRPAAAIAATLLVGGVLAASYVPGRLEYERLCRSRAVPELRDRARADGFFRTRLYPHEARQFLEDGAFSFVEAPHLSEDGAFVRYTLSSGGDLLQEETSTVMSRFAVREDLVTHPLGTVMTEKTVYERGTDRMLARAASVVYAGGPLSLFLGVYGMRSCPDIRTSVGSSHFTTFYDLERIVLGG